MEWSAFKECWLNAVSFQVQELLVHFASPLNEREWWRLYAQETSPELSHTDYSNDTELTPATRLRERSTRVVKHVIASSRWVLAYNSYLTGHFELPYIAQVCQNTLGLLGVINKQIYYVI